MLYSHWTLLRTHTEGSFLKKSGNKHKGHAYVELNRKIVKDKRETDKTNKAGRQDKINKIVSEQIRKNGQIGQTQQTKWMDSIKERMDRGQTNQTNRKQKRNNRQIGQTQQPDRHLK